MAAAEVVDVVLEGGGGVVDLESALLLSLLDPEEGWASGAGGDMFRAVHLRLYSRSLSLTY